MLANREEAINNEWCISLVPVARTVGRLVQLGAAYYPSEN